MAGAYYYLVAGLPDIGIDDKRPSPPFHQFADELYPLLTKEDADLLYLLRLGADNKNLAYLLDKREAPFEKGGNFSKDELTHSLHDPEVLPLYMKTVIEAWQQDLPVFSNLSWEDQISWLFYDYTKKTSNRFLKDWFSFDLNLRNILTGIKCREYELPVEHRLMTDRIETERSQAIIGRDEIAQAILESTAPDFDVTPIFPYAEEIFFLTKRDKANSEQYEKGIDKLRWDWLSERTRFHHFHIENILTYCIKLGISNRWKGLDQEKGLERLEVMLGTIEEAWDFEAGEATGGLA